MANNDRAEVLALLKRVQLFTSLSDEELGFVASHLLQRKHASGEVIFTEGDPCAGLYIVQAGNIRIFKSSASGREQVLAVDGGSTTVRGGR